MPFLPSKSALILSLLACATLATLGQEKNKPGGIINDHLAEFIEPDFPFFSSVLDARASGKDNLTPRGIILNLGHDLWACFDTDLLRIACIWKADAGKPPLSLVALAPGSYHVAGQKTKDGQDDLPQPLGSIWTSSSIHPGWVTGEKPDFSDPRQPTPSVEEVGRGPLPPAFGKFQGLTRDAAGVLLRFTVGTTQVRQRLTAGADTVLIQCSIDPHGQPFSTRIGSHTIVLPPSDAPQLLNVTVTSSNLSHRIGNGDIDSKAAPAIWRQVLTTKAKLGTAPDEAYVMDSLELPKINPWKRNLRLADLAFLDDQGNAAAVSFDGDVWLLSGLKGDLQSLTWRRFTSGLHEPMSIVARGKNLFVFDRNGIWTFADDNGDGEADRHELLCNLFSQTAETREFPNSMKLGPDGSFYLSKGGQEGTTRGRHNGTVLRVSPDGSAVEVVGYGLRQPFIGVNARTGLVTASDQQGHYVPSTPLHIVEKGQFYGHLPTIAVKEKYPATITEPLTWIPHPVNPSGATQVWLYDAKLGPINDELMHIGYNRPELFRVLISHRFSRPQAAVMSFSRDLDFGPLNAHVNPADGQLYVIGFQVWGTTAKQLSGISRLRHTGLPRVLLKEIIPTDKGLILRFNAPLDPTLAKDPASYTAERWNYQRTPEYGSPHLKPDGSNGQEWITPSSAYLSTDGKSVFVGIPGMKAGIHQMRIGWGLAGADGLPARNTAYFSPWELATFDSQKEGFGKITVDLTPRAALATTTAQPTAAEGARLAEMFGCMACHSIDGTTVGKVGPSWKGIYGSERDIAKGQKGKVKADDAYLRESILSPSAKVVRGFEKFDTGMPIYAGILNDSQIDSLILYLKQLK